MTLQGATETPERGARVDANQRQLDNLRIADGSILPRVTTGNTMAPCVIVGEKAAALITSAAGLAMRQEEDRAPTTR